MFIPWQSEPKVARFIICTLEALVEKHQAVEVFVTVADEGSRYQDFAELVEDFSGVLFSSRLKDRVESPC